jgi:predicted dehydrogenase
MQDGISRRTFLGSAAAAAGAPGLLVNPGLKVQERTVNVGLIGCGGRGTGAAEQALYTKGPTKLVAMADVLSDRLEGSYNILSKKRPNQVDVPAERRFIGMDGFKKAVDAVGPGGVVLLTTPPAFRPMHLEYAVEKGCHVFMEKSFAVDGPGIRRVLKAGKKAGEKGLKIAGGLMSRHSKPTEDVVQKIHDGAIGDVITIWAYRMHESVGFQGRRAGETELAHQIRNYSNFTWLNGSFLLDWLIHGLDICCWAKNAWPVGCQGHGGRQVRTQPDQLFDHYVAEYHFADGTRLVAQGRHMNKVFNHYICTIHGSKGTAVTGEGKSDPYIYKGWKDEPASRQWAYKGPGCNAYQVEHDLLHEAIRLDKPYNETERCAYAALVGIMGRMACESGKYVTWEQALNSEVELAPGLDALKMDGPAPVKPDEKGQYPVAMPGVTQAF